MTVLFLNDEHPVLLHHGEAILTRRQVEAMQTDEQRRASAAFTASLVEALNRALPRGK